jgi:hypothetical protein
MWTKQQVQKFQQALALVDKHQPALDKLVEISKHAPEFADRVQQLVTRAENVRRLASVAITADPTGQSS